jgi:hypothetical protein
MADYSDGQGSLSAGNGKRPVELTEAERALVVALLEVETVAEAARRTGTCRRTVYNRLRRLQDLTGARTVRELLYLAARRPSWGAAAALGLLALVGLPAPARAYLWQVNTPVQAPAPLNLRCSDIFLPKSMTIRWDCPPGLSNATYHLQRVYNGTTTDLGYTQNTYYVDVFDFVYDGLYAYQCQVYSAASGPDMGLPAPPACANPADIYQRTVYTPGPYAVINVLPKKVDASENQTVDARYDLRYGNPTYLDHQFKATTYYGGLYAGYNADPARMGRSYLKFNLPPPGSDNVWAGSVNCYYTRSRSAGSTTVGCQGVSNNNWDAASLKWSTAPAITPGNASQRVTLTYTSQGGGGNQWCHCAVMDAIAGALTGNQILSVALASIDETTTGWAYFAKKEYDATKAPCVLYALRAPLGVAAVNVTPLSITGGSNASGTVYLNGVAPAGGLVVNLASSDTSTLQVPASVTIPAGSGQANFTVTTSSVASSTQVTVTAGAAPYNPSVQVTVTP